MELINQPVRRLGFVLRDFFDKSSVVEAMNQFGFPIFSRSFEY
jgi:hypothetical protein